jgi:hypothetical protein
VDDNENQTKVSAPSKFLGDWSSLNGTGWIEYDHRIFDSGPNPVFEIPYEILISGPGGSAYWRGGYPSGQTDWVHFEANLVDSEWVVTSGTWSGLLTDVTQMLINVEQVSNVGLGEIDGIDNIALVPEPGTLILLAIGGLAIMRRRRTT